MGRAQNSSRMKQVLHYIECNLDEDIDCNQLAELACYSKFHFHRLFHAYTGEGVYAFRKRLLLERAVKQLQFSNQPITEIAFQCGYENQASFNKAFRKRYSQSPSDVRKQMISLFKPCTHSMEQEIKIMNPEIVNLDNIAVISARGSGDYHQAASEAWSTLMSFAYRNKLMKPKVKMYGISYDDPSITEPERIRYDAAIDVDVDIFAEEKLRKIEILGGKYAKFLHRGSHDKFAETYAAIFSQWLPSSDFKLRDVPCFEIYLNRDPRKTKPENLRTELYIPIE